MKNTRLLVAMTITFFAFACDNQQNQTAERTPQEQEPMTQKEESKPLESAFQITPEEFTKKAYESNLKEVQMAELASKKATGKEVKSFAQTAIKEHNQANKMLEPIAKSKNITVPASLPENEMQEINDLKEKSGTEFSKEYIEKVVDMHEETVDLYSKASENLKDTALSNYASKMLPNLQRHLEQAKNIQKQLEEKPASVK